jgi:DNA primase
LSGFIPERVLDEIRFRNDIVEVIGAYVPLKRTGSTYKACCPFHKEKTPSFNVNPNMQIFKCFGCGEGGDVISFMMKHQGMDFVAAARALAERVGLEIEIQSDHGEGAQRKTLYAIHHGISQFYRRCLEKYPAAQPVRDYVKSRGLDPETVSSFEIGYAPAGWDNALKWGEKYGYSADQLEQAGLVLRSNRSKREGGFYDRFRDRLIFPVHDSQGRVIAFSARILANDPKAPKYVNSPETPIFSKGRVLYGLDKARRHIVNSPSREAIVCEGQVDVIRCHQHGFSTAIAAQGTAFTDDHVQLLKNYADSVVLVFDSDSAGQAAAIKTAHLFMKVGLVVRIARLPAGEDPDSFLRDQGTDGFRACLEKAGSVVAYEIDVLSEREHDARGIAATARIANAVIETLCCCTNAVQRERLLQESATLLNIPQRALEADLAVKEDALKQQTERHARRAPHAAHHQAVDAPVDMAPPLGEVDTSDTYDLDEPPPEVLEMLRGQDASANGMPVNQPNDKARERLEPAERDLCELLAQSEGESALVQLVDTHLPMKWLKNERCRKLVEMVIHASHEGVNAGVFLSDHGDDELIAFWQSLKANPSRVLGGDYTRQDAVQDLILGFWRRHLQAERERLALPQSGHETGGTAARRIQITMDLKALKRWESGEDVIQLESAMLEAQEETGATSSQVSPEADSAE